MKVVYCGPIKYVDNYEIQWSLTNRCNYNCSYCGIVTKNEKFSSLENMKKNLNFLYYLNNKKEVKLTLFGGEPTHHPEFLNLLKIIELQNLSIFTNLSKDKNFLKKVLDIKPTIRIKTSFHKEYANLNDYIDKIKFIAEHGNEIYLCLLCKDKNKETIENYNKVKNATKMYTNVIVDVISIHPNMNEEVVKWGDEVNSDRFKIKYDNGNENEVTLSNIIYNNLNCFGLFKCYCGINNLFIDYNFDVHYCQTYRNHHIKPIFNLINDNYKDYENIFSNAMLCKLEKCYCEGFIKKEKVFNRIKKL
jgi:MoaA/NifB/PqqE/SkfB family radical SAM enzyme